VERGAGRERQAVSGFTRQAQLAHFARYDSPVVNVCAPCETADFATPAKAKGLPPFTVLLHALCKASLDIEALRWRLEDGAPVRIEQLTVSYTVVGRDGNLNFSTFPFDPDFGVFLDRYLADRITAAAADHLRLDPMPDRAYIFVTCLPWLTFTSIQHPIGQFADASIPNVAAGRFAIADGRLAFPLAVQAHHGLVDGLHIAQYVARVAELLEEARVSLRR
jgi:chloramphenicol O-acetyltransferase type A